MLNRSELTTLQRRRRSIFFFVGFEEISPTVQLTDFDQVNADWV